MKNSNLKRTLILLFSFLLNTTLASEKNRKPNIIFFLVDDLGWSDVAAMEVYSMKRQTLIV